jgi:hypothetical protein
LFEAAFAAPHDGHMAASRVPHSPQNPAPSGLSCWQPGHFIALTSP